MKEPKKKESDNLIDGWAAHQKEKREARACCPSHPIPRAKLCCRWCCDSAHEHIQCTDSSRCHCPCHAPAEARTCCEALHAAFEDVNKQVDCDCPCHTEARQEGGGWRDRFADLVGKYNIGGKAALAVGSFMIDELKAEGERAWREERQIIAARIEVIQAHANNRAEYGAVEDLGRLLSRLSGSGGETKA